MRRVSALSFSLPWRRSRTPVRIRWNCSNTFCREAAVLRSTFFISAAILRHSLNSRPPGPVPRFMTFFVSRSTSSMRGFISRSKAEP